jgi:hypothetical protein
MRRINRCFNGTFPSQNYFPKQKNRKKKKAILIRRTDEKPKGNGISPEG